MSRTRYRKMRDRALFAEKRLVYVFRLIESHIAISWCFYCKNEFSVGADKFEARAKLEEHVMSCPQHPMRQLEHDLEEARAALLKRGG